LVINFSNTTILCIFIDTLAISYGKYLATLVKSSMHKTVPKRLAGSWKLKHRRREGLSVIV